MERQAKDGSIFRQIGPDEWEPVTRKAKDGTVFQKVGADDWAPVNSEGPKSGAFETAVMQGLQGATAGLLDEGAGGAEAVGRVLGIKGVGGSFSDLGFSDEGPTLDPEVLAKAYRDARDKKRGILKQQSDERPGLALTSQIVGAIGSPANKLVKGASLVKGGAILGGANAFGASEADSVGGVVADTAIGTAGGALLGKGTQKVGEGVKAGLGKLAQAISPARQKMNAAEIREAAKRLGIKVTPGMLDDTGFIERLESALAKSPSYLGQSVKRNQDAVVSGMREAGESTLEGASKLTNKQTGEAFKSGVTAKVAERMDPLKAVFDDVRESTQAMELSERSLAAVKRNIEGLDLFRLTGGKGKAGEYVEMVSRMKTANDVKTVMTLLNDDIGASMGAEKQVLGAIKEKLSNLEKNSIMRSGIQAAKEGRLSPTTGKQIGKEIVTDLQQARRGWRELNQDLTGVGEVARLRSKGGPVAILDQIEKIPSEDIADKFLKLGNSRQMQSLATKFPEEFELLKAGRLRDIAESAMDQSVGGQGAHNTVKFLREIRKLEPEAKQALFGKHAGVIDDLALINQNIPRNFNPSGTASEQNWYNIAKTNVKDIGTYALYRGASSNLAKDVSQRLSRPTGMGQLYQKNPQAFQSIANKAGENSGLFAPATKQIPMAAGDETEVAKKPLKGEDKWANDGLEKIQKATGEKFDRGAMLKDKKMRRLFIEASDLKPGSKAMNAVIAKLKAANNG